QLAVGLDFLAHGPVTLQLADGLLDVLQLGQPGQAQQPVLLDAPVTDLHTDLLQLLAYHAELGNRDDELVIVKLLHRAMPYGHASLPRWSGSFRRCGGGSSPADTPGCEKFLLDDIRPARA